jgi:hypothetical protein
MSWFRRFRSGSEQDTPDGIRTAVTGDTGQVTTDLDSFGPDAQKGLFEEIARTNRLPLFEGTIKHGFSRQAAGSTVRHRCRSACDARTAGYFCSHAPP